MSRSKGLLDLFRRRRHLFVVHMNKDRTEEVHYFFFSHVIIKILWLCCLKNKLQFYQIHEYRANNRPVEKS